jgi:hypothetical protein
MNIKPWYKSLTLWVNVLVIAIAVLTALSQPDVLATLPPWADVVLPTVLAILNIILRAVSGQPITNFAARRTTRRGA